ncbi:hypothetical protein CC1G_13042 [Coprinopsis cinerea okayama7|uniref:Helitron helicase-like domain-containing protein n=1 Tax=Coprinopsis cinerea (strain Okayama-7 / 130 / ATCC MYA-4618 / FGSC 9003) TaxID=240176 RepID=A8N6R1_COPC7|nr:hypothetical protein CC1G_13042 [Coprinopsis cinerea okayama7\|eukprot:XP_001830517.2 hypothetical protein CC1G_13042 [Coprinopsis cinerea okayama7\
MGREKWEEGRGFHGRHWHTLPYHRFLSGLEPYTEPLHRHDLGRMSFVCAHCGAAHWYQERLAASPKNGPPKFASCCAQNQIQLPQLPRPPYPLDRYLTEQDPVSRKFREDIWKYNRTFLFTSLGVQQDHSVNRGNGPPVFRISGELHHNSGALMAPAGMVPRYSQLFILEPNASLTIRQQQNTDLNSHILQGYNVNNDVSVHLRLDPQMDRRRYNLPTHPEVAIILPTQHSTQPHDIVLRLHHGPLQQISDLHPSYLPLQYPLLYPQGENGWHPDLKLVETEEQQWNRLKRLHAQRAEREARGLAIPEATRRERRLTLTRWAAYYMHFRLGQFNILHRAGGLFNRLIVDMYTSVDQNRLRFINSNQSTIRAARFSNLTDAQLNDPDDADVNEIGKRVFLPSSYVGGPHFMTQCYQDSMVIVGHYKKVDIFLTMTTNPHWPEILRELEPGQTAYDRPDLVARVFEMKRKVLVDFIVKTGIFGKVDAYVYTIEFQKRGLPHMHLLIFLKASHKLATPSVVDSCISAEWPDPTTQPLLFESVKRSMVHGPCGAYNPRSPCMVNGKCSKGYPKSFNEVMTMDANGYPNYRHRDDGRPFEVNRHMVDNRWIVPHPPSLIADFDCHINMECTYSLGSVKYTFKYIQKGPDRGALEIEEKDEVKQWIDGRYISAPDATWRLFRFKIHDNKPTVVRLQVHLPGHHTVNFNPNSRLEDIIQRGATIITSLTTFFNTNADSGALRRIARPLTYPEFPSLFVFNKNRCAWTIRKKFARMLEQEGNKGGGLEEEGRAGGSQEQNREEGEDGEAGGRRTRRRRMDVLHQAYRRQLGFENPVDNLIYDYGLYLIDTILEQSGYSLSHWPSMPRWTENWREITDNPLIAEQCRYNQATLQHELQQRHFSHPWIGV